MVCLLLPSICDALCSAEMLPGLRFATQANICSSLGWETSGRASRLPVRSFDVLQWLRRPVLGHCTQSSGCTSAHWIFRINLNITVLHFCVFTKRITGQQCCAVDAIVESHWSLRVNEEVWSQRIICCSGNWQRILRGLEHQIHYFWH